MHAAIRNSLFTSVGAGIVLILLLLAANSLSGESQYPGPESEAKAAPYANTFFDPDPKHPWNQIYGLLFIRPAWNGETYGLNEMDPLYWHSSRYLLQQPLHAKALAELDQFIQADSAHLIKSPIKRALIQHMLWALFDNCAYHFDPYVREETDYAVERRELQIRLVKIMKSVALTDDEIHALPDNLQVQVAAKSYPAAFDPAQPEQPFLPANFYARTDWVGVQKFQSEQIAPVHVKGVSGRSGFDVFISLPTGRPDTLAYLKKLHDFQPHWVYDRAKSGFFSDRGVNELPLTNAAVPQVPLLTKFAMVRKANLIDDKGQLVDSPLTESVQIRVIRTILPNNSSGGEQSFFLFTLDDGKLMSGQGGLLARGRNEKGFDMVLGGQDNLEQQNFRDKSTVGNFPRLSSCFSCHSAPGIFSMNSYIEFFQEHRTLKPPELVEGDSAPYSMGWKEERYTWGLLQAYWFTQ